MGKVKLGLAEVHTWTTCDGRVLLIEKMSTDHLKNVYRMLVRKNRVRRSVFDWYLNPTMWPQGEYAQEAVEQEQSEILSKIPSEHMDWIYEELRRRGYEMD